MPFVYVLQNGEQNLYKIGWTRGTVDKRLREHSTSNPHLKKVHEIETKFAARCETHLKQRLLSRRLISTLSQEFYTLDRPEVDAAVDDAQRFINEYASTQEELRRLNKTRSNGKSLKPKQQAIIAYERLLKVREEQYQIGLERVRLETELKMIIGEFDGLEGIITWRTDTQSYFDEMGLKEQDPILYSAYVRTREVRRFLLNDPCHRQEKQ
jgi:Meiotically up-regulated gene 113